MTLSTTSTRVSAAGNGGTTTFPFSFKIWAASNLKVYLRDNSTLVDTLQTLNTHYTIDIVTYPNTGNVVFVTAPAAGKTIVIVRDMPLTQELDLIASGAFAAENVEAQLDKLAGEIQTLREMIARTPIMPIGTALADLQLPEVRASVAANFLGVNATGDGWSFYASTLSSVGVSSFAATMLDDTNAAAVLTTLGVSAFLQTVLDDADALTARATLGLRWLEGTVAAVNFASIANGANSVAQNITVTGAALGDFVLISSSLTLSALLPVGYVSAVDTVTFYLVNQSGGAVDLPSQDYYARVWKRGG